MRASARPEAVAVLAEGGIKERLQHLQERLLDQTIRHRRDTELVLAPSGLGIATRRTGLGRYVPDNSCSRIAGHAVRSCAAVWSMSRSSTPATPLLARTRFHARCRFSLASAPKSSADPVPFGSCRGRRASSLPEPHADSPRPTPGRPACAGI